MEVVEWRVPQASRSDEYHFYPIGDIHLGCAECAENDLERRVHDILEDEHAYVIGMGDWLDAITLNDPRFSVNGLASWVKKDDIIRSQEDRVKQIFGPLAREKRIIAILTGNHEEEVHKRHTNDITRHLCKDLGVPYGGYQCFISLTFDRCPRPTHPGDSRTILWHAWHGAGAAQTEGARVMRLMRLVNEILADVYTMGHIHGAISTYTPDRLVYDTRTHKLRSEKVIAALSGSWVKAFMQATEEKPLGVHYGELKGYKPARIGCPCITIRPTAREITVSS